MGKSRIEIKGSLMAPKPLKCHGLRRRVVLLQGAYIVRTSHRPAKVDAPEIKTVQAEGRWKGDYRTDLAVRDFRLLAFLRGHPAFQRRTCRLRTQRPERELSSLFHSSKSPPPQASLLGGERGRA